MDTEKKTRGKTGRKRTAKLYTAAPCRRCKGTERYVSNDACPSCNRETARKQREARRAKVTLADKVKKARAASERADKAKEAAQADYTRKARWLESARKRFNDALVKSVKAYKAYKDLELEALKEQAGK